MDIERLGPYRIVSELGRGGMGNVYKAVHVESNQRAAVKLLSAELAREVSFRERFEAEIETLRRLHHPNIVRLFGFGTEGNDLYYAMELVNGPSLEQELVRGRPFSWREVTEIGIDTCRALQHAHNRGVIHRDIKPGNLMLASDGRVKLSDFGIARLFGNTRLTTTGKVVGTAEYMSPEQACGKAVDARSDLYSLAAVLYVLLTRRPLFTAESLPEMLDKQRSQPPEPIADHALNCPDELAQIVMLQLAKDPEQRVATAALLARRLEAMKRGLEQRGMPSEAGNEPGATSPEDTPATLEATAVTDRPGGTSSSGESSKTPAEGKLPETQAVTAVDGPLDGSEPQTPPPAQFTPVSEEELDPVELAPQRHPLNSPQTWLLGIALVIFAVIVYQLVQPPSPEMLYQRIEQQASAGNIESLRKVEDEIRDFLRRYPEDARAETLRAYQKDIDKDIELDQLERQLLRLARVNGQKKLQPVEISYLEALKYSQLDLQLGIAKLEALINLFGGHDDASQRQTKCLELAQRRLTKLRQQTQRHAEEQQAILRASLQQADQLRETDPRRAEEIYRAVIELYGSKPWAADAVKQARAKLDGK